MLWSLIKKIYEAPGGKAAALQSQGGLELTCTLQLVQGEEQGQAPTFPVGMIPQVARQASLNKSISQLPQASLFAVPAGGNMWDMNGI